MPCPHVMKWQCIQTAAVGTPWCLGKFGAVWQVKALQVWRPRATRPPRRRYNQRAGVEEHLKPVERRVRCRRTTHARTQRLESAAPNARMQRQSTIGAQSNKEPGCDTNVGLFCRSCANARTLLHAKRQVGAYIGSVKRSRRPGVMAGDSVGAGGRGSNRGHKTARRSHCRLKAEASQTGPGPRLRALLQESKGVQTAMLPSRYAVLPADNAERIPTRRASAPNVHR